MNQIFCLHLLSMKGKLLALCTVLIATFIAFHNIGSEQLNSLSFVDTVCTTLPPSHHSAPDSLKQDGTTLLLHSRMRNSSRISTFSSNVNRYSSQKRSFQAPVHSHLFVQLGKLINTKVVLDEMAAFPLLSLGKTSQSAFLASLQVMVV